MNQRLPLVLSATALVVVPGVAAAPDHLPGWKTLGSVATLGIVDSLPKNQAGRHIGHQLVRSATAAAANYEEARHAESRADFIHKICVAKKEAAETLFWIQLITRSRLSSRNLSAFAREADELVAILVASARTARRNG